MSSSSATGFAYWDVEIPSSKLSRDTKGQKYTYYNIVLKTSPNEKPVHIVRRYRQFSALHAQLVELAPNILQELDVRFPKKQFFGRFDDSFREQRRESLQIYLRKIISNQYLTTLDVVKRFFNASVNEHGRHTSNPHLSRDIPDFLLSDS